ncbi:zf-HC2 domain-containing protein [Nonomuraea sp. MCN248]|uniref:Zf-HC2 domain-containing protein n=1 Tax=Nonomuraea corallina TaxID=2989783 RepID=A0ABT4S985_9ACTN|nr:zf-HC2 domain-containing protein [Nonomuraea corallina]MDA0633729.1 zf-HC2 domain-containing protein [Nonomuraea corallina]
MTGDTHYDLDALADFAEGLLDVDRADRIRDHLAVCPSCGELLADLAAVREVLAATPTPAMPMGVALRIDKALAAEAESRRGGIGLAEEPDWDELMRDAPWERQEPVRLGVVSDDGTVLPARTRTVRRRRWAMPAVAAAAAAAVVGTAVVTTSLLASGGGEPAARQPELAASSQPSRQETRARAYALTDSGHNYSDQELRQALGDFLAPAPIVGGDSGGNQVDHCVSKVSSRAKLEVFAVDQGHYNGQEAIVMASWKNKEAKRLRIDVVDPFNCKNLRKPALGRW